MLGIGATIWPTLSSVLPVNVEVDLPDPVLIEDFSDLSRFSRPSGAEIALRSTGSLVGSAGLEVDAAGVRTGTLFATKSMPSPRPAHAGTTVMLMEVLTPGNMTDIGFRLQTGGGSKNLFDPAPDFPGTCWRAYGPEVGSTSFSGDISLLRPLAYGSSTDRKFVAHGAWTNAAGVPTVLLRFHDALAYAHDVALPILKARGLVGTVHLATSFIGNVGSLTWDQVRTLRDEGWGIALGTTNDAKWGDVADPVADWNAGKAALDAEGLLTPAADHLYWTSNSYSASIAQTLLGAGVATIHDLSGGYEFDRFGPSDEMRARTRSTGIGASTTAASVLGDLDAGVRDGVTWNYHTHADMPVSVLTEIADGIAAREGAGLACLSVDPWWRRVMASSIPT